MVWTWRLSSVSGSLARKKATELNSDISKGQNPIISKQLRRAEELAAANNMFEQLAREWLDGKMKNWVGGTATRNKGALELHVFRGFKNEVHHCKLNLLEMISSRIQKRSASL